MGGGWLIIFYSKTRPDNEYGWTTTGEKMVASRLSALRVREDISVVVGGRQAGGRAGNSVTV